MSEELQAAGCINGCGDLTLIEKPISILHIIPMDMLEEGWEEENFGHIVGVCAKCGFVLCKGDEKTL